MPFDSSSAVGVDNAPVRHLASAFDGSGCRHSICRYWLDRGAEVQGRAYEIAVRGLGKDGKDSVHYRLCAVGIYSCKYDHIYNTYRIGSGGNGGSLRGSGAYVGSYDAADGDGCNIKNAF